MPPVQLALYLAKSRDLIAQTVKELGQAQITTDWLASSLTVSNPQGALLQLRLKGSVEPDLLKQVLEKHIVLFGQRITDELNKSIEKELERVRREQKRLEKRKKEMLQAIEAVKETLKKEGSKNVDAIIIWSIFNSLYSRLLPIEQELENLSFLEEELNDQSALNPLSIISAAFVPEAPIGPNKRQNILIAGVLGLFLGVLLAFFVHYMEGGKEQQISKSQVSKEA